MTIADLRNFWRSELDRYRADGAFVVADRLIARFLESLDQLETDTAHGVLNLRQAAALCGYSAGYLGRLIRQGKLPNRGRPNAPRLYPSDLPRKANGLPSPAARANIRPSSKSRVVRSLLKEIRARPIRPVVRRVLRTRRGPPGEAQSLPGTSRSRSCETAGGSNGRTGGLDGLASPGCDARTAL